MEFHHPPKFPWILAPTPKLRTCVTWVSIQRVAAFYHGLLFFVFGKFLVGLVHNGLPRSIINETRHKHWRGITFSSILSFSSLIITWWCRWWRSRTWGCRRRPLLSWRCLWSWMIRTGGRTHWQAWNQDTNEVLRVALYPNFVFNEMWFFDRWSIRKNIHFHRKAFQVIRLLACFRWLSELRMYPILWRILLPLHASAFLHWRLWPS